MATGEVEVVIEGDAPGADSLGGEVAEELRIQVLRFPAMWHAFGAAAGPIRNRRQLKEGKPNVVLAFHNDLRSSKGTKDMVNVAKRAGVYTEVISEQQQ